jgi:hypothetical protein
MEVFIRVFSVYLPIEVAMISETLTVFRLVFAGRLTPVLLSFGKAKKNPGSGPGFLSTVKCRIYLASP